MGIITTSHDAVVEITLDWPEVRNALGPEEGKQLLNALWDAQSRETTAAIVLTANGKAFCAGGNLAEIVRLAEQGVEAVRLSVYGTFQAIFRAIGESPIPVITAVDGPAVGFGCDLALAGEATFIGKEGWLAQGWAKAGLIPATGGTLYVARRGGPQAVWRLLAADRVDAATADAWRLAIACDNARDAALAMAGSLASLPLSGLRAVTQLARIGEREAHLEAALEYQAGFITSTEFAERARAILGVSK